MRTNSLEFDDMMELIEPPILVDYEENEILNSRITPKKIARCWKSSSSYELYKIYEDGTTDGSMPIEGYQLYVEFPIDTSNLHRTITGERVKPTQITSLVKQNPVKKADKKTLYELVDNCSPGSEEHNSTKGAWVLAYRTANFDPSGENFGMRVQDPSGEIIPRIEKSTYKIEDAWELRWYCPEIDRSISCESMIVSLNESNGQASFYCIKCASSKNAILERDITAIQGKRKQKCAIKPSFEPWHEIPAEYRDKLAEEGYIPAYWSSRKSDIRNAIIDFVKLHARSSFTEIDTALNLSEKTASRYCHQLEKEGVLKITGLGRQKKVSIKKKELQAVV